MQKRQENELTFLALARSLLRPVNRNRHDDKFSTSKIYDNRVYPVCLPPCRRLYDTEVKSLHSTVKLN